MFRPLARFALNRTLSAIPLRVYQRLIRRDVVGLCYHTISAEHEPHVAHLMPYKTPAQFEADLRYLADIDAVISYEQLRRFRNSEFRMQNSKPSVLLTFDDGLRECFTVARPLLLKYKLPAIFFITTDFIDNQSLFYRNKVSLCLDKIAGTSEETIRGIISHLTPDTCHLTPDTFPTWLKNLSFHDEPLIDEVCRGLDIDCAHFLDRRRPYMTKSEIQQLHTDGFTIGAHGKTHQRLGQKKGTQTFCAKQRAPTADGSGRSGTRCPSPFSDRARELVDSCRIIADMTGETAVPFAFPFSGDGADRADLSELKGRNKVVDLIFDRRGFRRDADFIVQRIIADYTPAHTNRGSNIPVLFRREYRRQARFVVNCCLRTQSALRPEQRSVFGR